MQEVTGFNDPRELLVSVLGFWPNLPKNTKIADFGCGTGLQGMEFAAKGYTEMYGVDGSKDMLAIAMAKEGVYK